MDERSDREVVVLGTASQLPTRRRNQNGYFLRFDGHGVLFDPGEGTQRQMTTAGVAASEVTTICITHFHGDHCLGLPGVLQRISLDGVRHPVTVAYPSSGQQFLDRLRHCSVSEDRSRIVERPVEADGAVPLDAPFVLEAARLDHAPDTYGWRMVEPDSRTLLPERLSALGVTGKDVGVLKREGRLHLSGRTVEIGDVSVRRPGQKMAFVMDTRICDAAYELAAGVDLLVCEATFGTSEQGLAEEYGHLTAAQAAAIAREAGARLLVITHFSQRYADVGELAAEARAIFPDVVTAEDLMVVPFPRRRRPPGSPD